MKTDDAEDVSESVVHGSTGAAGTFLIPWTARRTPNFDVAAAEQLAAMKAILSKFKQRQRAERAPVCAADYQLARTHFWSKSNATLGHGKGNEGGRQLHGRGGVRGAS
ncbi:MULTISPECIES: hypothetical protein [unclassified Caballeronia]|uniref:hypothetical protein n=1 Tax=unclassified Caballeronia TaxID=2646786 RepID=UPI002028AF8D|nr:MULTISPECIES: hypothetical protein [unclassified Caballeronia]